MFLPERYLFYASGRNYFGNMRNWGWFTDEYFENLQTTEIQAQLQELGEPYTPEEATKTLRVKLKFLNRQWFFKVWHDHLTTGGHSHLILISPIYDPAFYCTPEEVEKQKGIKVDVPNFIEKSEINILGQSTSSLEDQMLYSQCRKQCLQDLQVILTTLLLGCCWCSTVHSWRQSSPAVWGWS